MRHLDGVPADVKSSALWGTTGGAGRRGNVLWGKGRNNLATMIATLLLPLALVGTTAATTATAASAGGTTYTAFMTASLTNAVKAKPGSLYNVIIRGVRGQSASS